MEQFFCKTKIISGPGSLCQLGQLHIRRLMIVADPFFAKNGTAAKAAQLTCPEAWELFDKVTPDPSVTLAAEGAVALRQFQPDAVVALGGGSAMDLAKAMVCFSGLSVRLIAVPTTSGSGSEVTDFAILTHDGVKHPLIDGALQPEVAVLDSDLVEKLPKSLIADGGFDILTHAVEAYTAKNASPITDALAAQAFCRVYQDLAGSFAGQIHLRDGIHTAATMAGMAFSQAGLGLCHALAHALGGELHIPHGRLNAILLPSVLEYNMEASAGKYADLARGCGISSGSDLLAVRALKNGLIRLRRNLQLPETLIQAGADPRVLAEKADRMVQAALEDPCCQTNPVVPDQDRVRSLLRQVWGHG